MHFKLWLTPREESACVYAGSLITVWRISHYFLTSQSEESNAIFYKQWSAVQHVLNASSSWGVRHNMQIIYVKQRNLPVHVCRATQHNIPSITHIRLPSNHLLIMKLPINLTKEKRTEIWLATTDFHYLLNECWNWKGQGTLNTLLIGYDIGKKTMRSTRTTGDIAAPTAKPYREQTAWGMIWPQSMKYPHIRTHMIHWTEKSVRIVLERMSLTTVQHSCR